MLQGCLGEYDSKQSIARSIDALIRMRIYVASHDIAWQTMAAVQPTGGGQKRLAAYKPLCVYLLIASDATSLVVADSDDSVISMMGKRGGCASNNGWKW